MCRILKIVVLVLKKIILKISVVVTHPHSYYVFTTFDGLNLPHFAPFCLFCDWFNNLRGNYIPGKSRQNREN